MLINKLFNELSEFYLDIKESIKNWRNGYGFVPTSYYSDPKRAISSKILPILKSYRNMIIKRKNWSRPTWVVTETDLDNFNDDQLREIWLEYLNKMIRSFELTEIGCYEPEAEIKEGLELFTIYYQHLWD